MVLVPVGITPTGVGIAQSPGGGLVPLCPGCAERLVYRSLTGPGMDCLCRSNIPRTFPGILQRDMYWGGPYSQCTEKLNESNKWSAVLWVERWTGLRGVELKIEESK